MFSSRPQRDGRGPKPASGYGRGTEIAVTPVVFVGSGWLLDRWLATSPTFTLLLAAVGIVGSFVKVWVGYDRDMRAAEAGKPWTRRPGAGQPPAAGGTDGQVLGGAP